MYALDQVGLSITEFAPQQRASEMQQQAACNFVRRIVHELFRARCPGDDCALLRVSERFEVVLSFIVLSFIVYTLELQWQSRGKRDSQGGVQPPLHANLSSPETVR
jgi:hypothetical protein